MRSRPLGARTGALATATALAVIVVGCTGDQAPGDDREPVVLHVLAGSELADMEPLLEQAAEATGVTLDLDFTGTREGVAQVVDGEVDEYDALWFPSNRYLALYPEVRTTIWREERIMASPVVLGLAPEVADAQGWGADTDVSWSDLAQAAGEGRFGYAMTNPSTSNSGFSALVAVAAGLADTGAALELADIERVAGGMQDFFSARELTASSSGELADRYVDRAAADQPGPPVDGLVNYESVLLSLNDRDVLPRPLRLVYPSDGVVTADYPLTLLESASPEQRDGYTRLVDHLLTPPVQRRIMAETHRRPANPDVGLTDDFGHDRLTELPFPARLDVVEALVDAYFDRLRPPVRTVYVLDLSGSMSGPRVAGLRAALIGLTGADDSLADRAQQFHEREEITFLPFDTAPRDPLSFVVPAADDGEPGAADQVLADVRAAAADLATDGDTAIYDALARGYDLLGSGPADVDDVTTTIVLMTDGENRQGRSLDQLLAERSELPSSLQAVPVVTVLFGAANRGEMERLAEATGGQTVDARSDGLDDAFRTIRDDQ